MAVIQPATECRPSSRSREALLEVDGVDAGYGLSHILFQVNLCVFEREVVALLGRNGAGKSTTLKTIAGLTSLTAGRVLWNGREISGKPSYLVAREGIGYVPQDRRIFGDLTVRENLEVGRRRGESDKAQWTSERVFGLFPALRELWNRRGGSLSGGEQQMLAIARTLMGNPRLLLLDEPSEGLAPLLVRTLQEQVMRLRGEGVAILLSEQNLHFTRAVSDRAYILEKGRIQHGGEMSRLANDQVLLSKYLRI
jgi:branched-chain amino acid transport system ATP-binding protein